MKKITLSIVLFALVSMIYFSSCTKCEIEKTTQEMTTTIVKGYVYANLDFRNDTNNNGGFQIQYEAVPTGTKLFAKLNSQDLDPNPTQGLDYQTLVYESTVGSTGDYEFVVPAGADNLNVTISAEDFEYYQIVNDSTSEMHYFVLPESVVSVSQGSVDFLDLTFLVN